MKIKNKAIIAAAAAALLGAGVASPALAAKPVPTPTPIVDANYIIGNWVDPTNTYTIRNNGLVARDLLVKIEDQATGDVTYRTLYNVQPGETRILETPRYSTEAIYVYYAGDYLWKSLDVAFASDYDRYDSRFYIHIDSIDPENNPVLVRYHR